jgi:hypothetical protein
MLTPDADESQDLADLRRRLDEVLETTPVPTVRARALLAAYQSYVDALSRLARPARPTRKART